MRASPHCVLFISSPSSFSLLVRLVHSAILAEHVCALIILFAVLDNCARRLSSEASAAVCVNDVSDTMSLSWRSPVVLLHIPPIFLLLCHINSNADGFDVATLRAASPSTGRPCRPIIHVIPVVLPSVSRIMFLRHHPSSTSHTPPQLSGIGLSITQCA